MEHFNEKILSLTDIHEITTVISNALKKPIIVEDEQFSLVAYSSYYINHFDEANQLTILSKGCPLSILETFINEGIVEQLKTISTPFRVEQIEEIGLNQRIVVSAKHKEKIMGYIWVQEIDHELTSEELDFLHNISFHVGKVLYKKNQLKLNKEAEKDQFYNRIMNGSYKTEKQIISGAANVNIILPSTFTVCVFTVPQIEEEVFGDLTETTRLYANALEYPTQLFIHDFNIGVILGSKHAYITGRLTASANELVNTVINHFAKQDIQVFAGVGNEYTNISSLRKCYLEALEVIKTSKFISTYQHVSYEYKKLGVFRYLETISQQNNQSNYVNEELLLLKQKDQTNQTSLLKTLEVYLLNNCKLKPTAEQLFIHTNTLKYRINQITELTDIDFSDFNLKCQLYIDLQLLKSEE
ncbi:PucR family transcriptional regulator [Bacillus tianshenii]|nr:PucR family transcriptional regulator [Bacillus tianshenii]